MNCLQNEVLLEMPGKYAIGVDVGGTHLSSAVIDLEARALCTKGQVTPLDCNADAHTILSSIAENINQTISAFGVEAFRIGLAFPGPFDYPRGIALIKGVQKFESLYGLNVGESLRSLIKVSHPEKLDFRFLNDAAAFALGETFCGAGKGFSKVMAISLGTGVGSGFISGGKIIEKGEGVPQDGAIYNLPFEGKMIDENFSTRWIVNRFSDLSGIDLAGAKDVADQYDSDPRAKQVFTELGERLGQAIGPIAEAFGAEVLVVGGSIAKSFDLFDYRLRHSLNVRVKQAELFDSAAMIGAAALFE